MKRNNRLDFLRFVAILIVIISHADIHTQNIFISHLVTPGYLGVELFFVISGFLITGLILNEYQKSGTFNPKLFLIRRGFKIYPPYFIFILIASIYQICKHKFILKGFFCDFFFISNYTHFSGRAWFWSLSLEEHFYFIICFISFYLIKKNKFKFNSIRNIYLFFLFSSFCFRLYSLMYLSEDWQRDYQMTHSRIDSLFLGSVSYFVWYEKKNIWHKLVKLKYVTITVSIFIIFINFIFLREVRILNMIFLSINSICFGILLIFFLEGVKFEKNILIEKLSYIGKYSYCIYLIHPSLGMIIPLIKKKIPNQFIYSLIYIFICFVSGIIMSKIIEIPFLKIRDKYFPSNQNNIV